MRGWIGRGVEEAEGTGRARGKEWQRELEVEDFRTGFYMCWHWGKNNLQTNRKCGKYFTSPPSGLKVQAKIHSLSCYYISLTLFLQLLLGKDITNLVGRESRQRCNLEPYY